MLVRKRFRAKIKFNAFDWLFFSIYFIPIEVFNMYFIPIEVIRASVRTGN